MQNLLHFVPRQSAWWPLVDPVSWCDHSTSEVSRQPARHLQKSKECSQRTAGIRNRALAKPGAKLSDEHVYICQSRHANGLRLATQLPEEATRCVDIACQRSVANTIMGAAVMAVVFQQR